MENKTSYNLGNTYVNTVTSTVVTLHEVFSLYTENGGIDLKVEIKADFCDIPKEYHEVFLNVLTAKYLNKVSFGDNIFSQCKPLVKKKWYQFWKK